MVVKKEVDKAVGKEEVEMVVEKVEANEAGNKEVMVVEVVGGVKDVHLSNR